MKTDVGLSGELPKRWTDYMPSATIIVLIVLFIAAVGYGAWWCFSEILGWTRPPSVDAYWAVMAMLSGMIVALVSMGSLGGQLSKGRSRQIALFAKRNRWSFREKWTFPPGAKDLPRFEDERRYVNLSDVVIGRRGDTEFHLFEYVSGYRGRNSDSDSMFTAILFHRAGRALPAFQLSPEGVLSKLSAFLGWQDIDFEDRPSFSGSFALRGENELAVRELFTAVATQAFEKAPGWSAEGRGPWTLLYTGKYLDVKDFPDFLEQAIVLDAAIRG